MEDKDHLGHLLEEKERGEEHQYFAARDRELIAKLKQQHEAKHEETVREIARSRCPSCGIRLQHISFHEMQVETCPKCQGMWLNKTEVKAVFDDKGEEWMRKFLGGLSHLLTHPTG